MATSKAWSPGDASFDMLTEITCQMCQETYSDPVVLPCLHHYCKNCVEEKARQSKATVCPKCHQHYELSQESIQKLPRGILASKSIALHSILAQRVLKDCEVVCELCNSPSTAIAKAFCQHCNKYICSFCEEAHERIRTYAEHTVLKLAEIPSILEKLGSTTSHKVPIKMMCPFHDKEMKVYCFECNKLVCRDCVPTEHKNHDCQFLKKASENIQQRMKCDKEGLEKTCNILHERRLTIQHKISNAQKSGAEIADFVNQSFNVVLQQFERYRSNLLQSVCNKTERDVKELRQSSQAVEMVETKILPLLSLMRHSLDNAHREEMLSKYKEISRQVSVNQRHCQDLLASQIPQAEPFYNYKTSCVRIIGAIGDSLGCADPIMCSLEGEGAKRSEVEQETEFLVKVNRSNEAPCTAIQNVSVDMASTDTCQTCETRIKIVRGSTYEVTYTPKLQGQHILKVKVNERPILGNPFHVLVKRPLLDVKEPILIIRGVKKLHDLALHRNGNLIGTQYETGTIVSIDKKDRKMKALLTGVGKPFGIATNQHGWIFLSQNKKCCLQKYSKAWRHVETTGCHESSLGNFNRPGRMAVNKKGEIFICDFKNSRVQVFDDDLEYQRWYSVSKPTGIALDEEGDIYVIENGKNSLCKVFVSSKLGMTTLRGGLANPQGVYVDKDYIYVTERDRGQVSVLDHEGELVTALGRGVLKQPGGIVGDQNGYLYVCDEELEAICVF